MAVHNSLYDFGTISMDRKYYGILITSSYRRAVLFFYRLVPINIGKTDSTKRYGTSTGPLQLLYLLVPAYIVPANGTPLNGIRYKRYKPVQSLYRANTVMFAGNSACLRFNECGNE